MCCLVLVDVAIAHEAGVLYLKKLYLRSPLCSYWCSHAFWKQTFALDALVDGFDKAYIHCLHLAGMQTSEINALHI